MGCLHRNPVGVENQGIHRGEMEGSKGKRPAGSAGTTTYNGDTYSSNFTGAGRDMTAQVQYRRRSSDHQTGWR
jgi:hypothetical protein